MSLEGCSPAPQRMSSRPDSCTWSAKLSNACRPVESIAVMLRNLRTRMGGRLGSGQVGSTTGPVDRPHFQSPSSVSHAKWRSKLRFKTRFQGSSNRKVSRIIKTDLGCEDRCVNVPQLRVFATGVFCDGEHDDPCWLSQRVSSNRYSV